MQSSRTIKLVLTLMAILLLVGIALAEPAVLDDGTSNTETTQPLSIPVVNSDSWMAPTNDFDVMPNSQIILHFEENSTQAERENYIQSIGATVMDWIEPLDAALVHVPQVMTIQNAGMFGTASVVESSELDHIVRVHIDAPTNDPLYNEQWAIDYINIPKGWSMIEGELQEITVAVIDTGVCMEHEDLVGLVLPGYDFFDNDDDPDDVFGHGCGVAGVIGAHINNAIGMAGTAPNVKILPVRVLGPRGSGSAATVAAGIVYAADNGADVINLSLGSAIPSKVQEDAVNYAISKGVVVVASAGNSGGSQPGYPANFPGVFSVGALDPDGSPSSFSNRGGKVWGPGRDIMTLDLNNGYRKMSGTSFSGPYVAGVVALVMGMGYDFEIADDYLGGHIGFDCGVDGIFVCHRD